MKKIGKIVNIGFGCIFAAVILLSLISLTRQGIGGSREGFLIILTLPAAVGICFWLIRLEDIFRKKLGDDQLKYSRAFAVLTLLLLAVQLVIAVTSDFQPINDLSYVTMGAENYITKDISHLYEGLPERHQHYFAVYPNNHLLFVMIAACYKLTYAITGEVSNVLPTLLNIAALDLSYIFMCKSARLLFAPEKALACAVRGLLFIPITAYAPYFYTDSLGMPFVTAAAYLYIKWLKREENPNPWKNHALLAGCAILLAVGYKAKGSAIIMLIAICVDVVIKKNGAMVKIKPLLLMGIIFALAVSLISRGAASMLQISDQEADRYQFPCIHWIMMSADGRGGYNTDDFLYTFSFEGYDNKIAADKERLAEKLNDQGAAGFGAHLAEKAAYTWRDGTYMAGYYLENSSFFTGLLFKLLAAVLHFSLLLMMLRGYLSRIRADGDEMTHGFFLKICHIGLLAFLLIWEARCRYLVSFFILFAMI